MLTIQTTYCRSFFLFGLVSIFAFATPAPATASPQVDAPLLKNSSFEDWEDKAPVGWTVEPGIFNGGNTPLSKIRKSSEGGIEIFGNKNTLAWNLVGQPVDLKKDKVYLLTFEAKTKKLKREVNQHDNCHIGFWFQNSSDKTVGNNIEFIDSDKYAEFKIYAKLPDGADKAQIYLTLSKTGSLFVKNMRLKELTGAESFDVLIDSMKAKYSYIEHKKIDFEKLATKYRKKANAVDDNDEFTEVIADMLAELKDGHTWIMRKGNRYSKNARPPHKRNFNFEFVNKELKESTSVGNFARIGKTKDGFGYIRINSLYQIEKDDAKKLLTEILGLFDCPGMIVDLRSNGGGAEPLAKAITQMFADKEYVYAKHKFRSGDGFGEISSRKIGPKGGKTFTKPMVCLIGPGAVSSGEGFALMMKALDHCQTIGQPTRGSSGNPAPVTLPNGVEVWFSRWVAMEADGTPIEDRGVMPDMKVEHDPDANDDPTFNKAIEILKSNS